jgi:hypothetical protein
MIATEAQSALLILQGKARHSSTNYWLERCERALDECSRNPQRTKPAAHQVRSALANAKKRIDDRDRLAPTVSLDLLATYGIAGVEDADETAVVDLLKWLESTSHLKAGEREILRCLARGEDAESLAAHTNVPVSSMRQKISRARASARAAWLRDHPAPARLRPATPPRKTRQTRTVED